MTYTEAFGQSVPPMSGASYHDSGRGGWYVGLGLAMVADAIVRSLAPQVPEREPEPLVTPSTTLR